MIRIRGVPIEGLQDLDALLLADRELPDLRPRVHGEPVARPSSSTRARSLPGAGRRARLAAVAEDDVLRDGEGSTSRKCWCTMPIPASIASRGSGNEPAPVELDLALVRAVEAGQDVRERRLAGSVLAEERMHLAAAASKDVVVRDDAGERFVIPTMRTAAGEGRRASRRLSRRPRVRGPPHATSRRRDRRDLPDHALREPLHQYRSGTFRVCPFFTTSLPFWSYSGPGRRGTCRRRSPCASRDRRSSR